MKEGNPSHMRTEIIAQGPNQWNHYINAPKSVDHTGDGGQQFDDIFQDEFEFFWNEVLTEKDGNGQAKYRGNQQRQKGAIERSQHGGQQL